MALADFNHIKAVIAELDIQRPSRFGFTEAAVSSTGQAEIDALTGEYIIDDSSQINSIPSAEMVGVDPIIIDIGLRTQAATAPRMALNHFFGRLSLNLLKLTDKLNLLVKDHLVHRYITPSGNVLERITVTQDADEIILIQHQSALSASSPVTASAPVTLPPAVYDGNAGVMTGADKKKLDDTSSNLITLDSSVVKLTGVQSIEGVKTFTSIPNLPDFNPTEDSQAVRRAYVDAAIEEAISVYAVPRIGSSFRFEREYIPIAPEFPWFCMSLPTQPLTTANFPQSFIDVLRNKKVVYGELGTSVSAFTGAWSGSEFTLDNNIANVTMIAALAKEWLFEKAMRGADPTDGWRILVSGGSEYNITNIVTSTRKITVSGSPSGTAIEIYLNRILGSTTSARHFSEAGLGFYQAGGDKISGLRRLDQMQLITGKFHGGMWPSFTGEGAFSVDGEQGNSSYYGRSSTRYIFNSANSPDARTGTKTEIEAGTLLVYMYTGGYVA